MARIRLSTDLIKKICDGVKRTTTIKMACAMAGVSPAAFYRWQAHGRELLEIEDDQRRLKEHDELCIELVERVERSLQLSCLPAIDCVMKNIKSGDVRAAERLLSRRLPDDFADYRPREAEGTPVNGDDGTGIALIPAGNPDSDLDSMLQTQQIAVKSMAKSEVEKIKSDQ